MDQNVIVSFEDFAIDNSKANLSRSAFDAVDDSPLCSIQARTIARELFCPNASRVIAASTCDKSQDKYIRRVLEVNTPYFHYSIK